MQAVSFARAIRVAVAGGGVLLFAAGAWMGCTPARPLPPDASLGARFREHRKEFDALAAMALADTHLVGAGHDPLLMRFTVFVRDTPHANRMLTDEGVRATGRSEYRGLLDRAGIPSIARSREGHSVRFVVMSRGGARKGIIYSEDTLDPLRTSLDGEEPPGAANQGPGYVPLAPRWFLFLEPSD